MAIEPIGTMSAVQYQSNIKVQPIMTSQEAERNMDVNSAVSATPKIDEMTAAVAKASESDTQREEQNENRENTKAENEAIKKFVENINKNTVNSEAVFGIHEGTNRVTIKIVDKETKKVIKELPPEKTLDMIARVWEMAGILVDEKR